MPSRHLTRRATASLKHLGTVPDQSGAYLIRSRSGAPQYAGKAGAGRLRERLLEHRRDGMLVPGDTFQYVPTASDREALHQEERLKRTYKPKLNRR